MDKTDYKDTLNLPETAFPMKANLPQREPELLKFWDDDKIYERMVLRNKGKSAFILHDGPPYANGHIHIGHALNKTLKDIIVKYKSMRGLYAPYVPGWDCHGLPIELEVDKKLGDKKAHIEIAEKRRLCREYAEKFLAIQRDEFKRLGVLGDWDEPYLTMSFDYEARIVREFADFYLGGYAYKGKKPVHWCPSCVTALAEAEVEYADKESPSVFVRFNAVDKFDKLGLAGKEGAFVIWTTTPWTLPANLALAVNPDVEYAAVEAGGALLVVADALRARLAEIGVIPADAPVAGRFKGAALLGMKARHPFIDRESKVIAGDFVTVEDGSGIVHIAPGHGEDDYIAGLREGLEVFAPVDDHGKFKGTGVDALEGQFVFKANETVINILTEKSALLGSRKLAHSYPHCWRCKKPVIFRATEQWFISMAHNDLRDKCLAEIDKARWIPDWGRDRIHNMVKGRPDWCISRQRSWGVPITVVVCANCGTHAAEPAVFDKIAEEVRRAGADVWYTKPATEFLPSGYKCSKCSGAEFRKEMDILDVWFDSGVSHAAVLTKEREMSWPADMYLEGSDQHRGWFQSSMLASVGTRGCAPYRSVLTHGFTVDGKGKKMSKSQGNVVAPQDVIKKTGAEILRLWVSAEDYRGDIRISDEILNRLTEAYRKIRNTAKYLLGNLSGFDGKDYSKDLLEIDRYAMSRLQDLTAMVTESYESYSFHEVYHRLYHFCVVDMSAFYLDILKDRLYTAGKHSPERRAAQWVLKEILVTMTKLMAPVMSFTAEEVWRYIEGHEEDSVFLADFPVVRAEFVDKELEARWAKLIAVRDEVNRALELQRKGGMIGNALEADVALHMEDADMSALLKKYEPMMPALFIVSAASMASAPLAGDGAYKSEAVPGLTVSVGRAKGAKCSRCWNWSEAVGTFSAHPELCGRCHKVVAG